MDVQNNRPKMKRCSHLVHRTYIAKFIQTLSRLSKA